MYYGVDRSGNKLSHINNRRITFSVVGWLIAEINHIFAAIFNTFMLAIYKHLNKNDSSKFRLIQLVFAIWMTLKLVLHIVMVAEILHL